MQQINLYPPETRREARLLSARTLLEIALLACFVFAAAGAYLHWQAARLEQTMSLLLGQEEALRARLAQRVQAGDPERAARLDRILAGLEQRLDAMEGLLAAMGEWADRRRLRGVAVFESLSRNLLDGVWLTRIDLDAEEGLRLAGAAWEAGLVPEYLELLVGAGLPGGDRLRRVEIEQGEAPDAPVRFLLGPERESG